MTTTTDPFSKADTASIENRQGREPYRRNGRYQLFHPETGKPVTWSGATTVAKTLADTYHLELWKMRMVAKGISIRDDLQAQACSLAIDKDGDRAALNAVAEAALEAAGGSVGANTGKALHTFTEMIDRGETPVIPAKFRAGVQAYQDAMNQAGIKPVPGMIECKVAIPELEICGQFDRLLTAPGWALPRIGDVKSQKAVFSQVEIAVQLAIYSRATHVWSYEQDAWVEMPKVDPTWALAMHMPAGKDHCDLLDVNVQEGWDLAKMCIAVRKTRSRKDLIRPYRAPSPETDYAARLRAATCRADLSAVWQDAFLACAWTDELEALGKEIMAGLSS